jgi:acetoin utilization protein AcuB
MMTAGELMTRDPATAAPETSIAEVWDLMRELDIRHVPIVERGALVGMVSDRDIAHVNLTAVLRLDGASALREELARPIATVMSADVIAVDEESELSEVIALLVEHKVGALPVVRPDTRQLVGILSYIDVLRAYEDALAEGE